MAAIKKRSLVDQVYEMLRGDIITLRRPLGSKLNVNFFVVVLLAAVLDVAGLFQFQEQGI